MRSTEPRSVACVEDEAGIRLVLQVALGAVGGYRVALYASAAEAIEGLAADPTDVILLDVTMPEIDGKTAFRRIRELPSCRESVVIFLTAKARPEERSELLALGAADVFVKPFAPMTLARDVAAVWDRVCGFTGASARVG